MMIFLITLSVSWTASSQITGISRDQKEQIVSTLQDYPLLKLELNKTAELNTNLNKLTDVLWDIIGNQEVVYQELVTKNEITEEQLRITKGQLKNAKKGDGLLYFGGGTLLGLLLGLIAIR
jgi:hypothetical protein